MPDVSRLRELLAEGTPGPWRIGLEGDNTGWPESSVWSTEDDCVGECYRNASEQDAALIVAAVNALLKLLDVVAASREWRDAEDALDALMDEAIPGEPWLRSDEERVAYGRIEIAGDALRAALASLEDPSLQA
jgi:hypothetical protein